MREDHWCPGHRQSLEEADVYHNRYNQRWCTFFKANAKVWPILGMGKGNQVLETISGCAFQDRHLAHCVARHVGEIHEHAEPVHLQDNLQICHRAYFPLLTFSRTR